MVFFAAVVMHILAVLMQNTRQLNKNRRLLSIDFQGRGIIDTMDVDKHRLVLFDIKAFWKNENLDKTHEKTKNT